MKFINKITLILFLSLIALMPETVKAQQDAQYTNYMYNTTAINPAYAGTREAVSVLGLFKTQWTGLDGAPKEGNFSLHMPLQNSNLGLGLSFVNDRIGPSDENTLSVDVAYRIKVSDNTTLSLGVKGTANLLNIDYSKLSIKEISPIFQNNIDNRFSPNVGAGAYWYSDKYYVGVSVPNILQTDYYDDNNRSTLAKQRMHFYFMGGYVFDLSDSIEFKPAFLTKKVSGAPIEVDLTANFMFNKKFILGAAYRLDAAVSFLAGFQITEKLLAGYSYDMETTRLVNYTGGSHEVFLRFEIPNFINKAYSPRFF